MILGADWLEECSPMWIDWKQKLMRFTYKGREVPLQKIVDYTFVCSRISSRGLKGLLRRSSIE